MFKKIYPYLLDPEKYRDYTRRHIKVPTWKTFGNRPGLTILRAFKHKDGKIVDFKERLDLFIDKLKLGNVVWVFKLLPAANYKEVIDEIKKRGLSLSLCGQHYPGHSFSDKKSVLFSDYPPDEAFKYLEKELGERFLGFDIGEKDGQYMSKYAAQMCPAFSNRKEQYLRFNNYFGQWANGLKNKVVVLLSLGFPHYFLKEANATIMGAETAQHLSNSQYFYSMIRGACKQYGVLWFGNASVWNHGGYKSYETKGPLSSDVCSASEGRHAGLEYGTSLLLLKRLIYTHYLYNSAIIGFEQSWIMGDDSEKRFKGHPVSMDTDPSKAVLSPVGKIQAGAYRFIKKHGLPGVMYAPVCLLLDFYSGWKPPRHGYTKNLFFSFGSNPWDAGDFLTNGIFSLLYPGHEDSGYYADERGYLTATPYGDMTDILLSDAEERILSIYSIVIVAGKINPSEELHEKLDNFVKKGGRLIITAGNIIKFKAGLAGLKFRKDTVSFPAQTEVSFGKVKIKENQPFRINKYEGDHKAKVMAKCGNIPVVVKLKYGKGEITALMSPFGIGEKLAGNAKKIGINAKTLEVPLPDPYPLLNHVQYVFDMELQKEKIFDVGEDLGYITCRQDKGKYIVGIYNNQWREKKFKIKSLAGKIKHTEELAIDSFEKGETGSLPYCLKGTDIGKNTRTSIAGGDIRIFKVAIEEKSLEVLPELKKPEPVSNRYLGLRKIRSIKEEILCRPTFFQHFSGVKISWNYLKDKELSALKQESAWLKRQKAEVVVDFSESIDYYPTLTFLDYKPQMHRTLDPRDSLKVIINIFDKMKVMGLKDAIFRLHRSPQGRVEPEWLEKSFLKNITQVCKEGEKKKITIHLQNHPRVYSGGLEQIIAFIAKVKAPNLKFCINIGHLLFSRKDIKEIVAKAGKTCRFVLISAPQKDFSGQIFDAHLPVSGSKFEEIVRRGMSRIKSKAIILDGVYRAYDEEYRDIRAVEAAS